MKKTILILWALCFFAGISFAQDINDEITLIQAEFGLEKRQIVESVMELPEPLSQGFWFVYQQYEAERQLLARERFLIIEDYMNQYESINDEFANSLALRTLKNDAALSKLHSKYYKKFKKATTATYAAKFFQLDTYIHNTIRNSIQQELPFIGEF
ncbi:hypothetical protein E4S40_09610 [Algoriphagus kandeliae]|uniref:Sensor of ECF-type sigma factor n=1 Tax=Algoriphagus kandeliae TaxID=2562278 RepID=A0A4Y9QRP0_9BACT|nr:hypothetical protein [Algoriphagus kandeliae]TFV94282.1 hypothetical protein E4S40_09610 [Algoriphagus kandeliae]